MVEHSKTNQYFEWGILFVITTMVVHIFQNLKRDHKLVRVSVILNAIHNVLLYRIAIEFSRLYY